MRDKKWYKWPQGYFPEKDYYPWYVIIRRLMFIPLIIVLVCIIYVLFCLAGDVKQANDFWNDLLK